MKPPSASSPSQDVHKSYSARLRVCSADLSADEIAAHVGLEPSWFRRKGEPRLGGVGGRVWSVNVVDFEAEGGDEFPDLESGLHALLDMIAPRLERIRELALRSGTDVTFQCAGFATTPEFSTQLSAECMARLAETGAELLLSVYAVDDE